MTTSLAVAASTPRINFTGLYDDIRSLAWTCSEVATTQEEAEALDQRICDLILRISVRIFALNAHFPRWFPEERALWSLFVHPATQTLLAALRCSQLPERDALLIAACNALLVFADNFHTHAIQKLNAAIATDSSYRRALEQKYGCPIVSVTSVIDATVDDLEGPPI